MHLTGGIDASNLVEVQMTSIAPTAGQLTPESSGARFRHLIGFCLDLTQAHIRLGGGKDGGRAARGRPTDQKLSINRSIIVLAVAAWQTAVEDFAGLALQRLVPNAHPNTVLNDIRMFSTPSPELAGRLLFSAGFDPVDEWALYQGRRPKSGTMSSAQLRTLLTQVSGRSRELRHAQSQASAPISRLEMDVTQWVQTRHLIAHGHVDLPAFDVLQKVRLNRCSTTPPSIRLEDARDCVEDVHRITLATAKALHKAAAKNPAVTALPAIDPADWQVDLALLRDSKRRR